MNTLQAVKRNPVIKMLIVLDCMGRPESSFADPIGTILSHPNIDIEYFTTFTLTSSCSSCKERDSWRRAIMIIWEVLTHHSPSHRGGRASGGSLPIVSDTLYLDTQGEKLPISSDTKLGGNLPVTTKVLGPRSWGPRFKSPAV